MPSITFDDETLVIINDVLNLNNDLSTFSTGNNDMPRSISETMSCAYCGIEVKTHDGFGIGVDSVSWRRIQEYIFKGETPNIRDSYHKLNQQTYCLHCLGKNGVVPFSVHGKTWCYRDTNGQFAAGHWAPLQLRNLRNYGFIKTEQKRIRRDCLAQLRGI